MTQRHSLAITLTDISAIRATEEHSESAARRLQTEIDTTGVWTTPLIIDRESMGIMDGHHRFAVAKALALALVPTMIVSYEDDFVHLKAWRPNQHFTPDDVRRAAKHGQILPRKTTRHVFDIPLPGCRVPLDTLRDAAQAGQQVNAATAHPTRIQMLSAYYHSFGQRLPVRTLSASMLDVELPATIVPHTQMRQELLSDPCMAALMAAAPCRLALGRSDDVPFRLVDSGLLLLPPALLPAPRALAMAARWGVEAAFVRNTYPFDATRLPPLLRHGAALLRSLDSQTRAHLLTMMPQNLTAELIGSDLDEPSADLIEWISGRIGIDPPRPESARASALDLDLPVEAVLTSNGDSRLVVDPVSGKNKYGTTPRPRPEAVHFSSSTASSISDYGFLYCDVLRRDLLAHLHESGETVQKLHARLSDAIIGEFGVLAGLGDGAVDGAIAPSGTDTELLAVMLARAANPEQKLVNILISPEETGRGVKLAGEGKYFDDMAATGAMIRKGEPVWPDADIEIVSLPVRDTDGAPIGISHMDAAFLDAGRKALATGARVLAHQLVGSKTGLSAPSDAAVQALVEEAPDRVDVVVDACQMRIDFHALGTMISRGWMVQVSGSKALTGPPFAGALLVPPALRDRRTAMAGLLKPGVGYAEDWSATWSDVLPATKGQITFGAAFRWLPALLEVQLWRQVSPALRAHILARFSEAVTERLQHSDSFRLLPRESTAVGTSSEEFTRESILAFEVLATRWDQSRDALGPDACRKMFEMLNRDVSELLPQLCVAEQALLRQEFHIGQPVELGDGGDPRTVLRLVLGFRFFTIVGLAGPGAIRAALESEISDLLRAIDKLEILAQNWWLIQS